MGSHGMRERVEHQRVVTRAIADAVAHLDINLTGEQVDRLGKTTHELLRAGGWRLDVLAPAVDQPAVSEDDEATDG